MKKYEKSFVIVGGTSLARHHINSSNSLSSNLLDEVHLMQGYNFEIEHIKGSVYLNTDVLSMRPDVEILTASTLFTYTR